MKTMKLEEFRATLKAQGVPRKHVAFKCPMCGTVQSMADLIAAGAGETEEAVETKIGFSCIGRFTGAGSPSKSKGKAPGSGCNWTLGGLFKTHVMEVETEDGKKHPHFDIATPEEAQEHMKKKEKANG